jgi:formate dehydrogenase subunit delta
MLMQTTRLITMANQIGDFFKSIPDEAQAKEDIAQHLIKFWAASMRTQLVHDVQSNAADDLMPLVRDAVLKHLQ